MRPLALGAALSAALLVASACTPPDPGRPDFEARAYLAIAAAESTRPAGGRDLEVLKEAAGGGSPILRAVAVRGLGRLENPALASVIGSHLDDASARVRAEAANALAQAYHRAAGRAALGPLLARVAVEDDPGVLGTLARSLGRLRLDAADRSRVDAVLLRLTRGPGGGDAPDAQLVGAVLGIESFARGRGTTRLSDALVHRLRELTRHGLEHRRQTREMVRIRTVAVQALARAGAITVFDVEPVLHDPAAEPRQAAAAHLRVAPPVARTELIRRTLVNPAAAVRLEAVRAIATQPLNSLACTRLVAAATRDLSMRVRLAALDGLDRPCPQPGPQLDALDGALATLRPEEPADWHRAAHALYALARLEPGAARQAWPSLAGFPNPFARAWAARVAGRLGDRVALAGLAADTDPNVRTAALREVARLDGAAARPLLAQALGGARDPQLLLTLAELLTPAEPAAADDGVRADPEAAPAADTVVARTALDALEAVSQRRRITDRDARVALLRLVAATGGAGLVPRVEPYLRDFDAAVASAAAATLQAWTGARYVAAPRPAPPVPLPTPAELRVLERSVVDLHMRRGGTITIALSPWLAPANAYRLWRMAGSGELDGLTFHRVEPNFVIQGLSPGANEYAGHGYHTPDELGLGVHWLGTVGVSTRGRDTGDGQIFVNLVDNVRLDHDYTVFGRVVEGMDVVDEVLEGDAVDRAVVRALR